jgi:hypothetical protein
MFLQLKQERLKNIWKHALRDPHFQRSFFGGIVLLLISLFGFLKLIEIVENRSAFVFNDPVLALLTPVDLTHLIFFITYFTIGVAFTIFIDQPVKILWLFNSYFFLMVTRSFTIWLIPFAPPEKMIIMPDPVVEYLTGVSNPIIHDLFYSGHTATMFLFFLLADEKIYKRLFLVSTILVATCILWQHVHYSVDVFAAPFFSYLCFLMAKKTYNRDGFTEKKM